MDKRVVVTGAVGALAGIALASVAAETGLRLFVVVPDENRAESIGADLEAAGVSGIFVAPQPSLSPYQNVIPSLKSKKNEFALLTALGDGRCRAAIVPARFLFSKLPSPESFSARRIILETGREFGREALLNFLAREGYARTDLVLETGDFAARGGVVDVFPPDSRRPIRVEFDGDEIASLRTFDPETQRSDAVLSRAVFPPFSASPDSEPALARLESKLGRRPSAAESALFLPSVLEDPATLLDHARDFLVAVFEPALVEKALGEWEDQLVLDFDSQRHAIPPQEIFHTVEALELEISRRAGLAFDRLGLSEGRAIHLPAEEVTSFEGRVADAAAELARGREAGERILVGVAPRGGAEKVARFLKEYDVSGVETFPARVSAGFRLRDPKLALYSEEQIFGPERTAVAGRKKTSEAFFSDLRDLKMGDFVVHVDYGIARFKGLRRIPVDGTEKEMAELSYAEGRVLLLPVERLDLIQKYSAAEGVEPRLDRLGGASWGRRKQAAQKAVRDLSEDLLKLYARRAQAAGFAFSKDSPWQKEFEDAFEYVETPDQAQAISDVKGDMEKPAPMDRLLCGDVGYGKTEVAMRAAFKAVLDGKQVAVLAPTTILADQHFRTFSRRFAAFPVTIELLSRFRDRSDQKRIVEKIADGSVDIVIATHRLLSRDMTFRDLGLLIVDEEQRFGVAQKERVKEWKNSIDILAMSATPIPRSLNLSLSGIRDLSIIETPPRDRLAIETQVVPKTNDVVREAIAFEIERGGQVFYVHNRVESIGAEKTLLADLLPRARIAVAHGQMGERELEGVMLDFVGRQYDILIATAIVENGIDIASVNTILIDRADHFGLSQLYQLRGRVGRSDKAAYCYLLIEPGAALSETARQRLATIREFCDLGAGFRIAAKDLEIRGSGNFLGAEQSGHISAVGFEMYLDLLEQAIARAHGEAAAPERSVTISLGLDLAIPESFLPDESLRLALYKRIARAGDDRVLSEIAAETEDRFGTLPEGVQRLLDFARIRRRAERLGLKAVEKRGASHRLVFDPDARIDPARVLKVVAAMPGTTFSPPATISLPAQRGLRPLLELLDGLIGEAAA